MAFTLPDLPYAKDALAPHMGAETVELHHDKHHNTYVVNANKLIEGTGLEGKSLEEVVTASYGKNQGLFNNAAQHWNHIEFWKWMTPNQTAIPGNLEAKLTEDFGSVDKFKEDFVQAGATQFGSGWCWLVLNTQGKLEVTKTPNAENPLVHGQTPLLGCDVWEHSYYLDFRNRRPDYVKNWVDTLVNWEYVAELFEKVAKAA
ncbi:MAG: superoxide dismutase [Alphaproteobacteria bacterium]